jgi:hypothetical protein
MIEFDYKGDTGKFVQYLEGFPFDEIDKKFQFNGKNAWFFQQQWENPYYGGSSLNPVINYLSSDDSQIVERLEIPNSLRSKIANFKNPKFITVKNVEIKANLDHTKFVDIFLLTDSIISDE